MDYSKILEGCKKYPKSIEQFEYGTAGFRAKAKKMNHVAFRSGILAGLRAKYTKKTIGLMITASHNPAEDNGVKIIDPKGDMLELQWEEIGTKLVNSESNEIQSILKNILSSHKIDPKVEGTVLIGWDTRASSGLLVTISSEGISSVNSIPKKVGLCSTPMLHFLVKCSNSPTYGMATPDGYYNKILSGFKYLWNWASDNNNRNYIASLNFDGANGVGAITMKNVLPCLQSQLEINIYNDDIEDQSKLNFECGADYVKQMQSIPKDLPSTPNVRNVSFDGDADRIIYYYLDDAEKFHILDGDRMSILFAVFLKDLVAEAKLKPDPSFGIVQTAYANGNSSRFIFDNLKVKPIFAKTGVKYLVQEAMKYDIGIYFEANGHGTVIFSDKLKKQIDDKLNLEKTEEKDALNKLHSFISMINESVGDALSDFLTIETILYLKDWSLKDWESLYQDLPSKLAKVTVKDRTIFTTTDAERKVVTPSKLQDRIDDVVNRYKLGRSFVRPSGTEDLVRVYAEAETQKDANDLCLEVSKLVYDMAGGIGRKPT